MRSERRLIEQVTYNMLFRWFVGLSMDAAVWDVTVFTKNRDRLLRGDVAAKFFAAVLADPRVKPLLSSEHFSVDGTLIEAWASMKSFRPKDGGGAPPGPGRNGGRDFHGEKRSNETHVSTTDPDARLARKSNGQSAKLCYGGHVVMENRHGLVVAATTTRATGTAERDAGEAMMAGLDRAGRCTLGADKNYDTQGFVAAMRRLGVTPHVAQHSNGRRSTAAPRGTRAMRSASASASGSRKCSAGARRSAACGARCSAGLSGWDGRLRCALPPTTSSDCRSCWQRLPEGRQPAAGRGSFPQPAARNQPSQPATHQPNASRPSAIQHPPANLRCLLAVMERLIHGLRRSRLS